MEEGTLVSNKFQVNNEQLREIISAKEPTEEIAKAEGIESIAAKLRTSLETGLTENESQLSERQSVFGRNEYDEPPRKTYFSLLFNALKEPILILLSVCATVEIILGLTVNEPGKTRATGWIDGAAILIAVIIVSNVAAATDYDKEKKFRALNSVKNDRRVRVKRDGKQEVIQIGEVQVGDIVILDTGDMVPADGIFVLGHGLAIDESNMNGEPEPAKKSPKKPILLSGTQVAEGNGEMLVTNVGMNSEWGITYSKLIVPQEDTPLQEALGDLAKKIGYIGTVVAVLVFLVLVARLIANTASNWEWDNLRQFLQFFTLSITIVVAAVPEGLPLAVTISLAYSMRSMLKDNNLVRHLQACETMGGATNICSDKTGTLTENRMTVTNGWFANKKFGDNLEESMLSTLNKQFIDMICISVSTNSAISTFIKFPKDENHKIEFIGSKTECALLLLTHKLKYDYNVIRKENKVLVSFPFSSEKKRSSCVVDVSGTNRLFVKGASEIILGLCDNYIDENMNVHDLSEEFKQSLNKTIEGMASEGLRTLTIAYKDVKEVPEEGKNAPDDNLTLIGIVGIKDPLRPEVPDAIRQCKSAGITVRMVTGDNRLTATSIAKSCGILYDDNQIVLEGPEFRKMTDEELDRILPKLAVLARSSPSDKHRLVTRLKVLREVVAVTGDGTNDGPALKAADVGFGMGIAGTEIAKEAADIIIMDDNFASIVKAVMWGRCVRGNIQKFLTFQLTVNLVSLSIVFIAAVAGYGEPLKPIQFLWINLIQDTFAALALATEKPSPELLDRLPAGRSERLITPTMWRNMVLGALYQLAILLMILFAGDKIWNLPPIENPETNHDPTVQYTILFNTFVIFQLFNEINCRESGNSWNAFKGIFSNWLFSAVIVVSMGLQIIFVQVGGTSLGTEPLNVVQWFSCIGLAASIIIVGAAVRTLVPPPEWHWLKYNVPIKFGGIKLSDGHQDDEDSKVNFQ